MDTKKPRLDLVEAGPDKSIGTDDFGPNKNSAKSQSAKLSRSARWKQANPKAVWAHACLHSALRRGLIERQPCEVCGRAEVDGHHDSYDCPMTVRWLCRLHHKAEHRRIGVKHGPA